MRELLKFKLGLFQFVKRPAQDRIPVNLHNVPVNNGEDGIGIGIENLEIESDDEDIFDTSSEPPSSCCSTVGDNEDVPSGDWTEVITMLTEIAPQLELLRMLDLLDAMHVHPSDDGIEQVIAFTQIDPCPKTGLEHAYGSCNACIMCGNLICNVGPPCNYFCFPPLNFEKLHPDGILAMRGMHY